MKSMDELARETGTDKASDGHHYTQVYEALFRPLRSRPITLLEIGVWESASLALWERYFTKATVVGIDLDLSRSRFQLERAIAIQGDATDPDRLHSLIDAHAPFDIVIDDGSHFAAHAQTSFHHLWPHMRPGGYYCIEDLHAYYWPRSNPPDAMQWLIELAHDCAGRGVINNARLTDDEYARLNDAQKQIESVTFYRSLCIIRRCTDER